MCSIEIGVLNATHTRDLQLRISPNLDSSFGVSWTERIGSSERSNDDRSPDHLFIAFEHKVIANLGQLSALQIDNLRKSLEASKANKAVVIQGEIKSQISIFNSACMMA